MADAITCTPAALATAAACFTCLPQKQQEGIITYLLCQLVSGGGTGTVQVLSGAFADPNGNVTPDDTTKPAIYYQLASAGGTGTGFYWQTDTLNWA